MGRRSKVEIRETLNELQSAASELSDRSERLKQAQNHIRRLEHLLLHGDTFRGHPNLSAHAVVSQARGFLYEWNDWGFMLDDQNKDGPSSPGSS